MGERAPQHVQNIVIRDYCEKNNLFYLLSSTEYAKKKSHLMLDKVLNELKNVDGIVAYSLFQLPENKKLMPIILLNKDHQVMFLSMGS